MSREVTQRTLDALDKAILAFSVYYGEARENGSMVLALRGLRNELAKQARVAVCEDIGFRHRKKGSSDDWHYVWHRSPDSYELRECEIETVFAAAPQPPSPAVDVEAVRAICQRMREHGGVGGSWADQLERAIGDET